MHAPIQTTPSPSLLPQILHHHRVDQSVKVKFNSPQAQEVDKVLIPPPPLPPAEPTLISNIPTVSTLNKQLTRGY